MPVSPEDIRNRVNNYRRIRLVRGDLSTSTNEAEDHNLERGAVQLIRQAAIRVDSVIGVLTATGSPRDKVQAFYKDPNWIGVETSMCDLMGRELFAAAIPQIREQLGQIAIEHQHQGLAEYPLIMNEALTGIAKAQDLLATAEAVYSPS